MGKRNQSFNSYNDEGPGGIASSYRSEFSEKKFWNKVKKVARKLGQKVLEPALKLYFAAMDKDTPVWAKSVMLGALGYFISPIDGIPDLVPVVGYTDDVALIGAALATVAAHIKKEHIAKAREVCQQWCG